MPNKASVGLKSKMPEGAVSIKYVKRARMWCKTWFENGQQKQIWSETEPKEK